ncbi:MAG: hypothetical protein KC417_05125, partial [Myxococcales bacterium]|nr:hypothetical protein [Myxococcales bacterium]
MRRRIWVGAVALTFAVGGLAASASATPVRGALDVSGLPSAETKGPTGYWLEWNGAVLPRSPREELGRHLAVVLVGEGEPAPLKYELRGGILNPEVVVVRAKSAFTIENTDVFAHQLGAEGAAGFESIGTSPGQTRTITIPAAGHWEVRDKLRPTLRGWVHSIADLVAVAEVDARGRFSFGNVTPGSYTLVVYFRDKEVARQAVN